MAYALSLSHIWASLVCLAVTVLGLLLKPQETWNSRSDSNPTSHERGPPTSAERTDVVRFTMQVGTVCDVCSRSNNNSSKDRTENNHLRNDNKQDTLSKH